MRRAARARTGDRGAVVAEFVAVAALCTLVLAALLQLAFALHVRTVLVDAAAEGAREGALADRDPEQGAAVARTLIAERLAPRYAADVSAAPTTVDGLAAVEVVAVAPLPVVALAGTATTVTVRGRALLPPPLLTDVPTAGPAAGPAAASTGAARPPGSSPAGPPDAPLAADPAAAPATPPTAGPGPP